MHIQQALDLLREHYGIEDTKKVRPFDLYNKDSQVLYCVDAKEQITHLNLNNSGIKDLRPLSALLTLVHLRLSNNQLTTLSGLESLIHLKELVIRDNKLQNLDALASLSALQELDCSYNPIQSLLPLRGCTALTEFKCTDAKTCTTLDGLEHLPRLSYVDIGYNNFQNLNALASVSTLRHLNCYFNKITDLEPLRRCTALQTLNASFNQISNIGALADNKQLNTLELAYNHIKDATALASCTALQKLDIESNPIQSLSFLSGFADTLSELSVSGQQVTADSLCHLTGLTSLRLCETAIQNWSFLTTFSKLEILAIKKNNLSDITAIPFSPNLFKLDLRDNQIEQLSPLFKLTQLRHLYLNGNKIQSVEQVSELLQSLPDLDMVWMRNNPVIDKIPTINKHSYEYDVLPELKAFFKIRTKKKRDELPPAPPPQEEPAAEEDIKLVFFDTPPPVSPSLFIIPEAPIPPPPAAPVPAPIGITNIVVLPADPFHDTPTDTAAHYKYIIAHCHASRDHAPYQWTIAPNIHPQQVISADTQWVHCMGFEGCQGICSTIGMPLSAETLRQWFEPFRATLKGILLDGCVHSDQVQTLADMGFSLVCCPMPATQPAAIAFMRGFYLGLSVHGGDVQKAAAWGKRVLAAEQPLANLPIAVWWQGKAV